LEHDGVSVREGPQTATGRSPATLKGAARGPGRAVRSPPTPSCSRPRQLGLPTTAGCTGPAPRRKWNVTSRCCCG